MKRKRRQSGKAKKKQRKKRERKKAEISVFGEKVTVKPPSETLLEGLGKKK